MSRIVEDGGREGVGHPDLEYRRPYSEGQGKETR